MAQPTPALLKRAPDWAIIRLVRALARDAAREDHECEIAERRMARSSEERPSDEACRNLRPLFNRPTESQVDRRSRLRSAGH
jgi:hypothetical protein